MKRLCVPIVLAFSALAHAQPSPPPPLPPAAQCWRDYIALLKDCEEQRFRSKETSAACLTGANVFLSSCLAHVYGLKVARQQERGDPVDLNDDGRIDVLDALAAIEAAPDIPTLAAYFEAWALRAR